MAKNNELQQRLLQIRDAFDGLEADQVADVVRNELNGEKAVCGNPHSCAIALFVAKRLNLDPDKYSISQGLPGTYIYDLEGEKAYKKAIQVGAPWTVQDELLTAMKAASVMMPEGVASFISRFDAGLYPDLATEDSLTAMGTEAGELVGV